MRRGWNNTVPARHHERLMPLLAAALGAAFFIWIAGTRVVVPTETSWAMQGDWRVHFLGWQFFRHEPWHLPPGRIDRYFAPMGTAIGLTDSIPIAALVLKPFAGSLPAAFQYLGAWLCLCFALQGAFGVLLMRLWTPYAVHQLLGATCFVLVPTLLMRTLHPALCAHWLILWALWLYFRTSAAMRPPFVQSAALGLVAGMVHPYLAVMVVALQIASGISVARQRRAAGVAVIVIACLATFCGWWLSGLYTVSGSSVLGAGGLRENSMNLLAPITPTGWSTLLPGIATGASGQLVEGFQYFGAGLLLLVMVAVVVRITRRGPNAAGIVWPLACAAALLAIYALSPRVTFADGVVFEITDAWVDRLSIFRATGRFFWPAAYLVLILSLAAVVSRLRPRTATFVLCIVIAVQFVDLREAYAERRSSWRAELLFSWRPSLSSPLWHRVLPHYSHVVTYPPNYCGPPSVDVESLAYLAGLHGASLNGGLVARFDDGRRWVACDQLVQSLLAGEVDDTRIYIGRPGEIDLLKGRAQQPLVCGVIDGVAACATARSYAAWRDLARLE
jgi:hypothetical protein